MRNRWDLVLDDAVPRNADLTFRFTFPWSLEGHALDWKLWRNSRGDGAPLIVRDNAANGGITVPTPADGKAYFVIPQSLLAARAPGDYYYFVRDLPPGGKAVVVHGALQLFGPAS